MSVTDREKWDGRYSAGAYAERTHPSELLLDWINSIPSGRALDVACGAGRNALFLAERGFEVDAVDISCVALRQLAQAAGQRRLEINCIEHDLDQPLVLRAGYQLILVIRFVDLPRIRQLAELLAPGGVLVCEEHLVTDAEVIGPGNPAYRVKAGELPAVAEGLDIEYSREGLVTEPDGRRAALAQLVARRRELP